MRIRIPFSAASFLVPPSEEKEEEKEEEEDREKEKPSSSFRFQPHRTGTSAGLSESVGGGSYTGVNGKGGEHRLGPRQKKTVMPVPHLKPNLFG